MRELLDLEFTEGTTQEVKIMEDASAGLHLSCNRLHCLIIYII